MKRTLLLALVAACGSFEDEDIVIDLRVLALSSTLPEQLVVIDLATEPDPIDLLDQLAPIEMCALVADPEHDRRLRWSMTLCSLRNNERCDLDLPTVPLTSGIAEDPDTTLPEPRMCATIVPDGNLLGILLAVLEGDAFGGLGGIEFGVNLRIGGETDAPDLDLFAGKTMRIVPKIPEMRTASKNPTVTGIEITLGDAAPVPLPLGRCVEQTAPLELRPSERVRLFPVEAADAREVYTVPTLDGEQQTFTESLTYQWLAGRGGYSSGTTGGPRDFAGNPAPLFTDFVAPREKDLAGVTDVPLWIVQRDERLGSTWYQSCLRIVP
ncbi:MAG: hypothetical protein WKG01_12955 [Kofleriaceae bacterium]